MDCHVLSYWHIHQDQPLCERERKEQEEKKHIERNQGEGGREVQGANAETKKKGKDSLPVCAALPTSPWRPTAAALGNAAKSKGRGLTIL